MEIKTKIYIKLVNRVPAIQKKYIEMRQRKHGLWGRLYAWGKLLYMNLCWTLGYKKWEEELKNPDINKKVSTSESESALSYKSTPFEFAKKLLDSDIISFDIFDTLIFRTFSEPTSLFFAVGERLEYLDFERIRREMEWRARLKSFETKGTYEVSLDDIYEEIELQAGVPKSIGMKAELELEFEFCYGNPFMLQVFEFLMKEIQGTNKKIICVSDMYLSSEILKTLLKKCGFHEIYEIYVSCEMGNSKSQGDIYARVEKELGKGKKYIHVGDNLISDVKHAKAAGWKTYYYPNINVVGKKYRAEDMSIINGSLYRGIVNSRIHCGKTKFSQDYELGYIYGGIFALGYCQFIHRYVKEQQIEKILFLSRDGNILHQVYQKVYENELEITPIEYVYWSRSAATKMGAQYFKYDYFRRFIDHKINQGYSLENIFKSMGLSDMLDEMIVSMPSFAEELLHSNRVFGMNERAVENTKKEAILTKMTKLTDRNAWIIKEFLISSWEKVMRHYTDSLEAGKAYYCKILEGYKKVAAVDVGWAGSGAIVLDYIVNHIWGLDCNIQGILAGSNTNNNAEPNASEPFLYSGKLVSYLYSQENNRDIWRWHNPSKEHNLLMELLLSSKEGSFVGFEKGISISENYRFIFKKPDIDSEKVEKIQKGILDFVSDYCKLVPDFYRESHCISGRDAYAVLKILLQSEVGSELEVGI